MNALLKIFTIYATTIFIVYSVGVSFSVHHCEHCGKEELYISKHPDCCSASTIEHHSLCKTELEENTTGNCCNNHHTEKKHPLHCNSSCCKSDTKYYKINLLYIHPNTQLTDDIICYPIDLWFDYIIFNTNYTFKIDSKKDPPFEKTLPLKQGGELFLIFAHQQILYA